MQCGEGRVQQAEGRADSTLDSPLTGALHRGGKWVKYGKKTNMRAIDPLYCGEDQVKIS